MLTENELTKMCNEICNSVGYNFTIPVKINKRLTRTLGRVIATSYNGYLTNKCLELSYQFLYSATLDAIMDVLKHECCHFLVTEMTHKHHGHDYMFKEVCARIGCTNDKATYNPEIQREEKEFKYTVKCTKCNKTVAMYMRAGKVIKNPDRYSCKLCGGDIIAIQNF